jgi:3-dehydroquinate synthase
MSESFEVEASTGSYSVQIESGAFERFLTEMPEALVIADAYFQPRFEALGRTAIFVEAHESIKSLDASPALIEEIRSRGAGRQTHLVAVGGGIVQDLSAFIASIYMRGLEWTYVPTTILAMADSCIGGKSSINVGRYKNLVGTFHPPLRVLIDPALAETLPVVDRAGGLVEAVKICFCRGAEAFDKYLACEPGTEMSTEALEKVVALSLRSKKWFIEIDEFDKNERLLLNFGHTFGHAIEGASHYAIPHGIAVGLGILCALEFERQAGVDYAGAPGVARLEAHLEKLIEAVPEVGAHLKGLDLKDVMERFDSDKKHRREVYTLILVNAAGTVELRQIAKNEDARARVESAMRAVIGRN